MRRRALLIHDEWTEAEIQSPYLVMEALEDGFNFSLSANALQYKLIEGGDWINLPARTQLPVNMSKGQKIWLKGSNMTIAEENGIGIFSTTGKFNLSGNCFALLYGDNMDYSAAAPDYCFKNLFKGTSVVNVSSGFLPCKTLGYRCYYNMFSGCPYLETAPSIPAETLAVGCCGYMFYNCPSLTRAPKLPALNLANGCYDSMFRTCTNLIQAPELPATTIVRDCYMGMFYNCTSLETAPDLLASRIDMNSYNTMFYGCSKLSYVKCLVMYSTDITNGMQKWLNGVAATGTLVKAAGSALTAPEGWTVVEI